MIRKLFAYPESAGALAILGGLFGAAAVGMTVLGNPASSGICASCFLVNVAGALHLHAASALSYTRPEIPGIVLGAFFAAFSSREFRVRGGSSPLSHFIGGAFILFGCEVFIGCPIKALLRTAGGGGAGVAGLLGIAGGVALAVLFIRDGFGFRAKTGMPEGAGLLLPGGAFLLLLAASMGFGLFAAKGNAGAAANHAPFAASAAAGLFFGAAGQRSRFCVTGSIGNALLARDYREGAGTAAFLGAALLLNILLGGFAPTVALEPGAHTDLAWAFLAMAMAGFGAILVSGCPFRQLVLAGSGDMDAAAAVAGMIAAASLSVTLGIGSSPAGVTAAGKTAVLAGWIYFLALGIVRRKAA